MKKTYRCFKDIEAENSSQALKELKSFRIDALRIEEKTFTNEEETIVLELARLALADADLFDRMAEELDLSDVEMKKLQDKIEKATN